MRFNPQGLATSIGSLPHLDEREAAEIVLKEFPQIPAWPQLPKRNFYEDMRTQFSQGLPGIVCSPETGKFYFDTSHGLDEKLGEFYQQYLAGNMDYFAISREYAAGFYSFIELLEKGAADGWIYLKGQVTGPISFGLATTDEKKRAIIYREEFVDILTKQAVMKAKWQIKKLKEFSSQLIIFIDEPYLASFGSAYINLDRKILVESLQEIIASIQKGGALAGIHCCGNTDWSLPLSTTIDILSFDAFEFIGNLALYADKLKEFLGRGGVLSWGIVPSRNIGDESLKVESISAKLESGFQLLAKKGINTEILRKSCLLTPSCGTGSLNVAMSEKILKATRLISENFRKKY